MEPGRWVEIKELFNQTMDQAPAERSDFLRKVCADDVALLLEVEQLLASDEAAKSFLATPWLSRSFDETAVTNVFENGSVINHRYRIEHSLGDGGMGCVYEAFDLELGSRVALKTLRPQFACDGEMLKRFRREVLTAHRVTHPNVCRVHHLDTVVHVSYEKTVAAQETLDSSRQGTLFLIMEFLEGKNLQEVLKERGKLSTRQTVSVARQVAAALDAAHLAGIVHRDIKPGNIMLCDADAAADGFWQRAVITDFGLARFDLPDSSWVAQALTRPGELPGTPAYMAPEQFQGGAITGAADIYSFGAVVFEVITGFKPAERLRSEDWINSTQSSQSKLTGPLPRAWTAILDACLHPDPSRRPVFASQVVDRLEDALRSRVSFPLYHNRPSVRWSVALILCTVVLVSLFASRSRLWKRKDNETVHPGALVYLPPLQNRTSEVSMNGITELLQASLSQSTQISLLDLNRVGDILQNMSRQPDAAITPEIAREIAMRAGAVRVVFATLTHSNGKFHLELNVQQPGDTPARYRKEWSSAWTWASSGNTSVAASRTVADASEWLRQKLGESADDIARLNIPPEDVTTPNWAALSDYALAETLYARSQREQAIEALQNAVAKDEHFALAYALLGDILVNNGKLEQGFEAYASALDADHGERLSLRERARIKGLIGQDTGDFQAAEAAYREYTLYYPHDYIGWFRRGMPLYSMDRIPEAIQVLERAHAVDPTRPIPLAQLVADNLVLGNQPRVDALLKNLQQHYPRDYFLYASVPVQITRGRYDAAKASIAELRQSESPALQWAAVTQEANLLAEEGQDPSAIRVLTERLDHDPDNSEFLLSRAHLQCRTGRFDACLTDLDRALDADASAQTLIEASGVLGCGIPLAKGASLQALRKKLHTLAHRKPSPYDGLLGEIAKPQVAGEMLLADGKAQDAVRQLREASALDPSTNMRDSLARALEAYAGQQTDPAATKRLLQEAFDLREPFALSRARIWVYPMYPPGTFTENRAAYLRLCRKLGRAPPSDLPGQITALRD